MEQLSVQMTISPGDLKPTRTLCLYAAVTVASMFTLTLGGIAGYPSPALPNINEHRNPFRVTDDQQSWTGSLLALGGAFGGLASGTTCDILGRKLAMMCTSLFMIVGCTVLAAATDYRYLYAGVLLQSFFGVINMSAATIYVSELTPPEIRGACISITTLAYSFGFVVAYAVGMPLPWNWLAIFLAALVALPNLLLVFLPESPYWFLLKGNREAAIHSVVCFQGVCDIEEIRSIEQSLRENSVNTDTDSGGVKKGGASSWKNLVSDGQNLKSLIVVSTLFMFQGFTGNVVLQMFTVDIFEMAGVSDLDPNVETIILGLFAVIGSAICPLLVDRIGRKLLMIASLIIVTATMAAAGTYFRLLDTNTDYAQAHLAWLPVVALSVSNLGYMVGIIPVPYILSCEVMPTNVRGSAQTVFMVVQNLATFACLKTFIYIQEATATSGAFFIYTAICALATLFATCFVDEEKSLSPMR